MFRRVVHPGVVLKDELDELGVTPTAFARQIDVPPNRVSQIIAGRRSVTGDTALRFGHWFGVEPQFWMNLQSQFDLVMAEEKAGAAVRGLPTARAAMDTHAPTGDREGTPILRRIRLRHENIGKVDLTEKALREMRDAGRP